MSDHRCLAGRKCAAPEIETVDGEKRRNPALTEKPDTICDPCRRRIRNAVEDLPRDYTMLHVSLGELTTLTGAKVSATKSLPLPIDQHKFAIMQAITDSLDRAAEIVSAAMNSQPPVGISSCADTITTNLDKLIEAPETDCYMWEPCTSRCGERGCEQREHFNLTTRSGLNFAFTLRDLHAKARAATSDHDKLLRIDVVCGNCGAPYLYQNPDTRMVLCRECGRDWTEDLFGLVGRMSQQQEDEVVNEELKKRAELAEWCFAELNWQLSLVLECPAESARELLKAHAEKVG